MLIEEMTRRLPPNSYPAENLMMKEELADGPLFGAHPLDDISTYMERLALLLPSGKTTPK